MDFEEAFLTMAVIALAVFAVWCVVTQLFTKDDDGDKWSGLFWPPMWRSRETARKLRDAEERREHDG